MQLLFRAAAFLAALWLSTCQDAAAFTGKVVGVKDGDTIIVLNGGREEKVRLYGIDCPEYQQDFGRRAKQFTAALVFGKTVTVEADQTDDYGRKVGIVTSDGACLNEELVKNGMAWVYRHFCGRPACGDWISLEERARADKKGLWAQPDPVPPWVYRRTEVGGQKPAKATTSSGSAAGPLHGNTSSKVYHAPSCSAYNCKRCTAVFQSAAEALAAGYKLCGKCSR